VHSGAVLPEDRQTLKFELLMTVKCHGNLQRSSSRSCIGGTTATAPLLRLRLLLPGVWRPPHPTRRSRACHCPLRQRSPMVAQGQCITTMQRLAAAWSWRWRLQTGTGCSGAMAPESQLSFRCWARCPLLWWESSVSMMWLIQESRNSNFENSCCGACSALQRAEDGEQNGAAIRAADQMWSDNGRQNGRFARTGRSAAAAAGNVAGGLASLPYRLLRGGTSGQSASQGPAQQTAEHAAAAPRAQLTESALAAKDAAAEGSPGVSLATPARPAAWEARLRVRGVLPRSPACLRNGGARVCDCCGPMAA
jgi:hypothetical protein